MLSKTDFFVRTDVFSLLHATTNDLASLINRLPDSEATSGSTNNPSLKSLVLRYSQESLPNLHSSPSQHLDSQASVGPYAQLRAHAPPELKKDRINQAITPRSSFEQEISLKKLTSTTTTATTRPMHKRPLTPLAVDPPLVFQPLHPAKMRIASTATTFTIPEVDLTLLSKLEEASVVDGSGAFDRCTSFVEQLENAFRTSTCIDLAFELDNSGTPDQRSFIEQLESAFRTSARIDLTFELDSIFGLGLNKCFPVPPVPLVPHVYKSTHPDDIASRIISNPADHSTYDLLNLLQSSGFSDTVDYQLDGSAGEIKSCLPC